MRTSLWLYAHERAQILGVGVIGNVSYLMCAGNQIRVLYSNYRIIVKEL